MALKLGVRRVVLARDLSIKEIRAIAASRSCRWRLLYTARYASPTAANADEANPLVVAAQIVANAPSLPLAL